jgi:hypothetical protein
MPAVVRIARDFAQDVASREQASVLELAAPTILVLGSPAGVWSRP